MILDTNTLVRTACPAKINLTFEILGTMADGYHEVRTLLQTVSLEDEITFSFSPGTGSISHSIYNSTNADLYPLDQSNLISRAATMYGSKVAIAREFDVQVSIKKQIPIGAGLAGGSANAAATLIAFNHFFDRILSQNDLMQLGSSLGADVPFCLQGGTCIATGRGDILQRIEHESRYAALLVKPKSLMVSTPWAYGEYDRLHATPHSTVGNNRTLEAKEYLQKRLPLDSSVLQNDLEYPVFARYTALSELRSQMEDYGCWTARLTGSGPTLFALVSGPKEAEELETAVRNQLDRSTDLGAAGFDIFIVEPVDHGARLSESDNV